MELRGYLEWEGEANGIFYREEVPANGGRFTVLFLHGQAFSSQTWEDLGDQGRNLRGFVPVAPVGTDQHSESDYKNLQLPTLIVYGENDATLGVSSLRRLRNIPGSVIHMIKGAGHACYMKNADEFHENLDNFLKQAARMTATSIFYY
ncbi:Protein abhd14a [Desmophyllum pertusum]|uniref:Protein abhd14a n=1 Tax=Desmophyllum pertusum TaxID=174260 RepID=A0A9W9YWZ0_9CNID|nr:Protein abhd14a [Desmophyllum pertusum]